MFELDSEIRITKELLLSKGFSQETYFEHYLGVPVKKGLFVSPSFIRPDNKPTCAFYKNKQGILKYKDFAGPTFDFVGAVMYIYQCSYYKALRIIANDFGFIKLDSVEKNPPKIKNYTGNILNETEKAIIQVEVKEFSQKELSWWADFGITLETLMYYKVFSLKSVFLNGNYFTGSNEKNPIYGYYHGKDSQGDELWRIYMPNKVNYRFLSNWKSTIIQGSKQLPKQGDFLVITKSLKDVMALHEFNIPAIAPNSENIFVTDKQYEKLSKLYKRIFILYDNDLPGVRSANKIRKKFKDLTVLLMPEEKDFTDYVKKNGKFNTYKLIEEWRNKLL